MSDPLKAFRGRSAPFARRDTDVTQSNDSGASELSTRASNRVWNSGGVPSPGINPEQGPTLLAGLGTLARGSEEEVVLTSASRSSRPGERAGEDQARSHQNERQIVGQAASLTKDETADERGNAEA